jgi:PilZ domain
MPIFARVEDDDRRGDPRYYMDMPAVLLEAERICEHVQIINVARLGFLARTRLVYQTGEHVKLSLPGLGRVPCRIIWCRKGMVGGQFVTPIDPETLP